MVENIGQKVCTVVFTFSNKQLWARVLAHEHLDEDESQIDKYHVE